MAAEGNCANAEYDSVDCKVDNDVGEDPVQRHETWTIFCWQVITFWNMFEVFCKECVPILNPTSNESLKAFWCIIRFVEPWPCAHWFGQPFCKTLKGCFGGYIAPDPRYDDPYSGDPVMCFKTWPCAVYVLADDADNLIFKPQVRTCPVCKFRRMIPGEKTPTTARALVGPECPWFKPLYRKFVLEICGEFGFRLAPYDGPCSDSDSSATTSSADNV